MRRSGGYTLQETRGVWVKTLQNRNGFHATQTAKPRRLGTVSESFRSVAQPHPCTGQLAQKIDWGRFGAAFAGGYSPDLGAPAKATRLMVGLQYLKYTFDESDESVVERWVENPYG